MRRIFNTAAMLPVVSLLEAGFFFGLPANVAEAGLLVSETYLLNRAIVSTDNGYFGDQSIVYTTTPVPVAGALTNAVGDTYSHLAYSFDWSGDTGDFRIDGAHAASHPTASLVQSLSTGHLNFTPMVDSLISLRVQYTYDLPDAFMEAVGAGGVSDHQAGITYAELFVHDFSFGPTSGSFDQTVSAVIPAGCNCVFVHTMRLTTEATNAPATDSGTVELLISPIPEPAAILPLVLGALFLRTPQRSRETAHA